MEILLILIGVIFIASLLYEHVKPVSLFYKLFYCLFMLLTIIYLGYGIITHIHNLMIR